MSILRVTKGLQHRSDNHPRGEGLQHRSDNHPRGGRLTDEPILFAGDSAAKALATGAHFPAVGGASQASSGADKPSSGAVMTTDTDLGIDAFPGWNAPETASQFSKESFEQANEALSSFEETINQLRETNQAWMRGEISGDVADQMRQQSRLAARMGGAGTDSQMARNVQARDFGTTSMQIQEAGMAREAGIAQLQQAVAGIREQRSQFMESMLEQSRQFGASLEQDHLRTQMTHRDLMMRQDQFNAQQNLRLVEIITNATLAMTGQQVQAAISDVSDGGITSSFSVLQSQLEQLLARSNPN